MPRRYTDRLAYQDMELFGRYLTLDLCERPGVRGTAQILPMVGMFSAWLIVRMESDGEIVTCKQVLGLRGSDCSLRVALLVQGWHKTGMPIITAAEKVAEEYGWFLGSRLGKGKRGRRSVLSGGSTEVDETVRTTYYKFSKRYPEIDVLLEIWFWNYVSWRNWVASVDEKGIELTVRDYKRKGEPENAKRFSCLADRIRRRGKAPDDRTTYPSLKGSAVVIRPRP